MRSHRVSSRVLKLHAAGALRRTTRPHPMRLLCALAVRTPPSSPTQSIPGARPVCDPPVNGA